MNNLINTQLRLIQNDVVFKLSGKAGYPRPGELYLNSNGYICLTSTHQSRKYVLAMYEDEGLEEERVAAMLLLQAQEDDAEDEAVSESTPPPPDNITLYELLAEMVETAGERFDEY